MPLTGLQNIFRFLFPFPFAEESLKILCPTFSWCEIYIQKTAFTPVNKLFYKMKCGKFIPLKYYVTTLTVFVAKL